MTSRWLIFLAQLLLGALLLEVWMYHPAIALERDALARLPLETAPAAMAAGSWLLIAPHGVLQSWVFRLAMLVMLAVGLVGTAFHLAIHAHDLAALLTRDVWLGNPPTLVPLAFAVGGLLGRVAGNAQGEGSERMTGLLGRSSIANGLHALTLLVCLVAWWESFWVVSVGLTVIFALIAVVTSLVALAVETYAAFGRAPTHAG